MLGFDFNLHQREKRVVCVCMCPSDSIVLQVCVSERIKHSYCVLVNPTQGMFCAINDTVVTSEIILLCTDLGNFLVNTSNVLRCTVVSININSDVVHSSWWFVAGGNPYCPVPGPFHQNHPHQPHQPFLLQPGWTGKTTCLLNFLC